MNKSTAMRQPGRHLPLSLVRAGETVTVHRVCGDEETRRHLREIGFVDGAEVHVVSTSRSNVITLVKGARFGLDGRIAQRIMVA